MMRKMPIRPWPMLSCALLMVSAGSFAAGKPAVHVDAQHAAVNATRLLAADQEPGNWMSTGRTYGEQRYPPLQKINQKNADKRGQAGSCNLDVERARGRKRVGEGRRGAIGVDVGGHSIIKK